VVEYLPSKHKALSSNPITAKKKKKVLKSARHQWLIPVILATQKAEIKRNAV
jgi:hypothetical protein